MLVTQQDAHCENNISRFNSYFILTFTVPEEFQYDPVSKTYGDPTRRPEIKSSTIEFIAPSEYMVSCITVQSRFML
jgi:hypothetical protein